IPFNPVADSEFRSPTEREIGVFHMKLNTLKQAVTMRRSAGSDISAACGQLVTRSKKHGSD
ncbi:MAG: 23S rRNA (adenine(2503)-C(2))-methyltransferase RlmN, partial [Candidatus Cloacimonetes bacterium]|nr:23S rRNA (adenine(2503)-C(2))-methyltransferase RlmN [Candidatus Cloacimonadota bacterium]